MEEKKIASKEVRMEASSLTKEQPQKLGYEELNQACAEMSQQLQQQNRYIQQLHRRIQQMEFALQTRRMDYLFKVVEVSRNNKVSEYACFSKDFVEECIAEIQESMTVSTLEEENKEEPKED